eukprot:1812660-Amphidinium_carterae.1
MSTAKVTKKPVYGNPAFSGLLSLAVSASDGAAVRSLCSSFGMSADMEDLQQPGLFNIRDSRLEYNGEPWHEFDNTIIIEEVRSSYAHEGRRQVAAKIWNHLKLDFSKANNVLYDASAITYLASDVYSYDDYNTAEGQAEEINSDVKRLPESMCEFESIAAAQTPQAMKQLCSEIMYRARKTISRWDSLHRCSIGKLGKNFTRNMRRYKKMPFAQQNNIDGSELISSPDSDTLIWQLAFPEWIVKHCYG